MSDIHYAKRGVTPTCTIASFCHTTIRLFTGYSGDIVKHQLHMVEVF